MFQCTQIWVTKALNILFLVLVPSILSRDKSLCSTHGKATAAVAALWAVLSSHTPAVWARASSLSCCNLTLTIIKPNQILLSVFCSFTKVTFEQAVLLSNSNELEAKPAADTYHLYPSQENNPGWLGRLALGYAFLVWQCEMSPRLVIVKS